MPNRTFVVNDETINTYGFKVLTSGIDLTRFTNNPAMLYMHDREKGVIGRWENIRKEGDRLLADAVFDENDPLGKTVKEKVENGFLNSVSMGITVLNMQAVSDTETAIESVLEEISIVDIPSNKNAVKLFFKADLKPLSKPEDNPIKEKMLEILNLPTDTSDEALFELLEEMAEENKGKDDEIQKALKFGLIKKSDVRLLQSVQKHDPKGFKAHITELKDGYKERLSKEIEVAVMEGRILRFDKDVLLEIGSEVGLNSLNALISLLPRKLSLLKLVSTPKSNWGLDEYRKLAPDVLANDPELYRSLLQAEKKKPTGHDLEWYRKNDPNFLIQNPNIYKTLIDKEFTNK